jgi:hypothetical protein
MATAPGVQEAAGSVGAVGRRGVAVPIATLALALVGTLWSDAPWGERLYAFDELNGNA